MDYYPAEPFPQAIVANVMKTGGANMQIPYDEAPFEATLRPGEKIRLYGGVDIQNDAPEAVEVLIRFDLREGFILTIEGLQTPIHIVTHVAMHSKHAIKVAAQTWQLVPANIQRP